jgi:phosphoenolpyruvate-protein phosphotransferase
MRKDDHREAGVRTLRGIAASPGIAIAPAYCYVPAHLDIPARAPAGPAEEYDLFQAACEQARVDLTVLRERVEARTGSQDEAAIFEAHLLMLEDPLLTSMVEEKVESGLIAEAAIVQVAETVAGMLAGLEDETFAARAVDVRDVGQRILRALLNVPEMRLDQLPAPVVIVANDLSPSDTAMLDPALVLGFCTVGGGLTSHSAILARTLGIPAVVGMGKELTRVVRDGMMLLLDGQDGLLIVQPTESAQDRYRQVQGKRTARLEEIRERAQQEARTADGRRVEVVANIGDLASAREAVKLGAEGVGLLRTEFLYLGEVRPPDEEKQVQIYGKIFSALAGKPVTVRTLDIGGDKPPSFLSFPEEANPFLGWRAIRICLDERALFVTQLRAILRAAAGHELRVMFPMICNLDELLAARALLEQARSELREEGQVFNDEAEVGMMVETPAAAVTVDVLAEAADFFSLGTNDLTQYTLAVDRGNARVAQLFRPLHPAVLRLIRQTIAVAHTHRRWVGMCGELAGTPAAIPILLGLGLDEFSMAPQAIAEAKELIGALTVAEAKRIAEQALSLRSADEVEAYMRETLATLGAESRN